MKIKVGYLLSYDYSMFLTSVKQLYNHVDKIVVGIDQDYLTWSGNKFNVPESFFDDVKDFDKRNIIEFYFDKFYISELSPMECETRERNLVLKKLGKGWKIQLDVDEYIYDFYILKKFLKKYWYLTLFPTLTPIGFFGNLITLFKKIEAGFLYIENGETFPFITNQNQNTKARNNVNIFQYRISVKVIHQSWARSREEITKKIKNWGHRDDFNTEDYLQFWNDLNYQNYQDYKNFHPLVKEVWNELKLIKKPVIDEFIDEYVKENNQKIEAPDFDLKNFFKSCLYRFVKN